MDVILASSSPARLTTLQAAGIDPRVIAPEIDESAIQTDDAATLAGELARTKGEVVEARLLGQGLREPTVLIACDTLLEIEGHTYGKPGSAETAIVRWYRMRGRQGMLHTGHYVALMDPTRSSHQVRVASTVVHFADLSDAEIAAYAATGEPERVAGGFTIDGFGGAFVTSIEGDPHNVVGISLPLVRQMLLDLGVSWPSLWRQRQS